MLFIKYISKMKMNWYTLRNEGSLNVLKEPLGLFCETRGSFDGVGFF